MALLEGGRRCHTPSPPSGTHLLGTPPQTSAAVFGCDPGWRLVPEVAPQPFVKCFVQTEQ